MRRSRMRLTIRTMRKALEKKDVQAATRSDSGYFFNR